jgi:hypothetical protein
VALLAVRPCRPFLRPRRGGRQIRPSLLEKARRRRRLAFKGKRGRGSSCRSLVRRRRLRWEFPQRRRRACRGDCAASQLPSLSPALVPAPRERSGRQTALARDCKADGITRHGSALIVNLGGAWRASAVSRDGRPLRLKRWRAAHVAEAFQPSAERPGNNCAVHPPRIALLRGLSMHAPQFSIRNLRIADLRKVFRLEECCF